MQTGTKHAAVSEATYPRMQSRVALISGGSTGRGPA